MTDNDNPTVTDNDTEATTASEARRAASRANGGKSRGPASAAGKARSRLNAVKHGLRARVAAMPNEDAAAVDARERVWNDYYRPDSPAAQHLVNECVRATLLADRCQRAHAEAVAGQVRTALLDWENRRDDEVDAIVAGLRDDPAEAVRLLKRFGRGCRWLVERWERLGELLDRHGRWNSVDRDEAVRLLGHRPGRLKDSPEAFLVFLYNEVGLADPEAPYTSWGRLFDDKNVPESLRWRYGPDDRPEAGFSLDALKEMVADNLAPIRELADDLDEVVDAPDRAGAADRALVLRDDRRARLLLRYQSESRTAFHRHYASLLKTLERDAARDGFEEDDDRDQPAPEPAAASPNEPEAPPGRRRRRFPERTRGPAVGDPPPRRDRRNRRAGRTFRDRGVAPRAGDDRNPGRPGPADGASTTGRGRRPGPFPERTRGARGRRPAGRRRGGLSGTAEIW